MNRSFSSPGRFHRRGSITVLSALVLTALVIIAGMSINLMQVSSSKTELRVACDAAAKAAAVTLGQTQDVDAARAAARSVASSHLVNGINIRIRNVDVRFGNSEPRNNGTYRFRMNETPVNAVRVNAKMTDNSLAGPGTFFIPGITIDPQFELQYTSIATRVDHDLCLVVDRSGSMSWDMSDVEWQYPGTAAANPDSLTESIIQKYFSVPHPEESRWAALRRSTNVFLEEVDQLPIEVQVGLVSYSSNFVFGLYNSVASTTESGLTTDYDVLSAAMQQIGEKELIGNTNVASGMQAAVEVLTGGGSRITAKGTMIVLTDGIWNQGTSPVDVAAAAAAANITVHTITFSGQADQASMQAVAAAGSGTHYHAPNEAALRVIFKQIAETLPAVLTQ